MDHQDVARTYNANAKEYAKLSLGREDAANIVRLSHALKPGAKILDVGCAAGRDCGILQSAGFSVTGVDISARLLSIAKKTYPDISFILADMRALPFRNQSFDAVWASAVLHHADRDEIQQVLEEFNRVLQPGGYMFILTKAGMGMLKSKEASFKGRERIFTLLTENELEAFLKTTHFESQFSEQRASKSRKNLTWLCVFAKKTSNM